MSCKEFDLIKKLTYSRLTAICAFEPPFCAYLLCGSLHNMYLAKGNHYYPVNGKRYLGKVNSLPLYWSHL